MTELTKFAEYVDDIGCVMIWHARVESEVRYLTYSNKAVVLLIYAFPWEQVFRDIGRAACMETVIITFFLSLI